MTHKPVSHQPKPIAVFLGPSLDRQTASSILDADFLPPVRFGDIYRLLTMGVEKIIIIDGVFHSTPSVWQREVLAALDEGIAVMGASSMGALRAAELHTLGMVGIGQVFEWYRDGLIRADDEVALHHATEEGGYLPISEPLVNIRATLNLAVERSILTEEQAAGALAHCRRLPYPERNLDVLLTHARRQGWPEDLHSRLQSFLRSDRVDIKRQDAISALKQVHGVSPPPPIEWVSSDWDRLRSLLPACSSQRGWVAPLALLSVAKRDKAQHRALSRRVRQLFFLRRWLDSHPELTLPDGLQTWRDAHPDTDLDLWRRANGMTAKVFENLANRKAHCEWAIANVEVLVPDTSSELLAEERFVLSWAKANGVVLPQGQRKEAASLGATIDPMNLVGKMLLHSQKRTTEFLPAQWARWIISQGPGYFGYPWDEDAEMWRLLQIEGIAAQLATAYFDEVDAVQGDGATPAPEGV